MVTEPRLSAEERRALKMLADAGQDGPTATTLLDHGFCRETLLGLVLGKLATVATEIIGPAIKIERYRITVAGRKAIKE